MKQQKKPRTKIHPAIKERAAVANRRSNEFIETVNGLGLADLALCGSEKKRIPTKFTPLDLEFSEWMTESASIILGVEELKHGK